MISLFCIAFISAGIYGSVTNGYVINKTAQVSDRLQLLAKLAAERHTLIRLGVCHYNGSVGTMGVQQFLGQWDCKTDATQPPLKRIPLIIAGDSHSADKVMALRLNGYAPLQMDAAGCSLRPKYMTKDCFAIFEKLYALTKDDAYYKYIAIARSFEVDELTLDAIKDTIEYWQKFNKKIILFTNMPVYTDMNRKFAHDRPVLPDTSIAELSERKEIMEYLVAHGVYVVNTREIFCRITKTCSYISNDGHLLLVDKHHLSRRGARLFGEILMEDNLFRSIVELD